MKTFSFSPLFFSGSLIALLLAGCASAPANQHAKTSMAMCSADSDKMGKGGCGCCGMHKEGMSHNMGDKPMDMMKGATAAPQGAMCMPGKNGMEKSGCACCGIGQKEMSPEMKKKHMEMMQQHHPEMSRDKMQPQPAAK